MRRASPGIQQGESGESAICGEQKGTPSWYYAGASANSLDARSGGYDGWAMTKPEVFRGRRALVSGASAGIGAALARELASHGAKLILTARRRERLEALAAELAAQGTEARVVTADLNDPSAPQQIYDATEGAGLAVDILVNNAGLGQYGAFHLNRPEQDAWQVRINCEAVVRLSRLFVPRMIERQLGWVLIVSSMASFQPMPYSATYAATKVFDRFLSLGLAGELEPFGIKLTALCPGPVPTEFSAIAGWSGMSHRLGSQTPEEVARKAVAALALGRRTIVPTFKGALMSSLERFIPTSVILAILAKALRPRESSERP